MWKVRLFSKDRYESISTRFIPPDDVVFVAALKRGPTVHGKKTSFVRCLNVAEEPDGSFLGLPMTILESSYISCVYSDFNEGIMGRWKLVKPEDGVFPTVTLLNTFSDANSFLIEVLKDTNPSWAKKSYEIISSTPKTQP